MARCPDEILPAVVEILQNALIRIRNLASRGKMNECCIEANHVHNLPKLLSDYRPELLHFYLVVEKKSYQEETTPNEWLVFEKTWRELEEHDRCCGVLGEDQ